MTSSATMLVFVVLSLAVVSGQWVNSFGGEAKLECENNTVMSFLGSEHQADHGDRRWQFRCKPVTSKIVDCYWTDYINMFDEPLLFICPGDDVLNGMHSIHKKEQKDRRFKLKCCKVTGRQTRNRYFTGYINDFGAPMNYFIPENQYIKGVFSYDNDRYNDRRWKLDLCSLV